MTFTIGQLLRVTSEKTRKYLVDAKQRFQIVRNLILNTNMYIDCAVSTTYIKRSLGLQSQ